MKMRYYILIGIIFLTINSVYAFRPGPMAGISKLYILQNSSEISVEEYRGDIKISESVAEVSTQIKLKYTGETSKKFNFSLYIRKEQVDVLLNGELFNYNYQNRDFDYTFNPNEELVIKANYNLSTSYTFSGPPGPWLKGYAFEVDRFPVREQRWGSKVISICEINVEFPNDFKVDPEPMKYYHDWVEEPKIERLGNKIIYSLKTKSECPYLTFSKVTSGESIFVDTVSKTPPVVYIGIVVALIMGFIIFYRFKKSK